jgi:predicted PurR-regulated permease PerM
MSDSIDIQGQSFRNMLVSLAAFIIIIAGMVAAQSIIVPALLSAFIAIVCSPVLFWLEQKRVPKLLAFMLVLCVVIAILSAVGAVLGNSINDFTNNLPQYQEKLQTLTDSGFKLAEKYKIPISKEQILNNFDPGTIMGFAGTMIGGLGGLLSQMMLIFITVAFILFETSTFPRKLKHIHLLEGDSGTGSNIFTGKIKRYLAIKTLTSLATAVIVSLGLLLVGVDYPFLWGMLAFFLNFIPSIGAILAAIPVLLLTLIQFGVMKTLWVAVGYTIVNIAIGNFVEPRFMGKELGLSPLIVFLSLVFWGWVLGPVGMFLSVPLTMTAKLAFDSREETKWIGILLGP